MNVSDLRSFSAKEASDFGPERLQVHIVLWHDNHIIPSIRIYHPNFFTYLQKVTIKSNTEKQNHALSVWKKAWKIQIQSVRMTQIEGMV